MRGRQRDPKETKQIKENREGGKEEERGRKRGKEQWKIGGNDYHLMIFWKMESNTSQNEKAVYKNRIVVDLVVFLVNIRCLL